MKEWQRGSNQGTNQKTAPKSTNKKQTPNRKSRVVTTLIASNDNIAAESGPPSIAGSTMTDNVTGLDSKKMTVQVRRTHWSVFEVIWATVFEPI